MKIYINTLSITILILHILLTLLTPFFHIKGLISSVFIIILTHLIVNLLPFFKYYNHYNTDNYYADFKLILSALEICIVLFMENTGKYADFPNTASLFLTFYLFPIINILTACHITKFEENEKKRGGFYALK